MYRGYKAGKIPFGHTFFHGLHYPTREDNPAAFHLTVLLDCGFGAFLCLYGQMQRVDAAPGLPWQ